MNDRYWLSNLNRHRDWLVSVAASRLRGDRCQAEEIVADLMAELSSRAEPAERAVALLPWLHRAVVNRTIDWIRQSQRHQILTENYGRTLNDETNRPLEQLVSSERLAEFQAVLGSLDPDDFEILTLKYLQGWSYQKIGAYLELSFLQVTHRLRRARLCLKQKLLTSEFAEDFQSLKELGK